MPELQDPREERLLNWLLLPKPSREPKTLKDLAADMGVAERTLYAWRENYHFKAEYERRWRQLASGPEKVKAVIEALHQKAMTGDHQAAKLYLEWAKEYTPRTEVKVEGADDLRKLSDAEIAERLRHLRAVGD